MVRMSLLLGNLGMNSNNSFHFRIAFFLTAVLYIYTYHLLFNPYQLNIIFSQNEPFKITCNFLFDIQICYSYRLEYYFLVPGQSNDVLLIFYFGCFGTTFFWSVYWRMISCCSVKFIEFCVSVFSNYWYNSYHF